MPWGLTPKFRNLLETQSDEFPEVCTLACIRLGGFVPVGRLFEYA